MRSIGFRRLATLRTLGGALVVAAIIVVGCAGAPQSAAPSLGSEPVPTMGPTEVASQQPSAEPSEATATIELQRAPPNLGCDAIGVRYSSAIIRIDPAAEEPVFGETNDGRELAVFWSEGFEGIDGPEPVVQDTNGDVVARDGEEITIPEGA